MKVKESRNAVSVKDLVPRTGKSPTFILPTFYPGLACRPDCFHMANGIGRKKAKTRDENHQLNRAPKAQGLANLVLRQSPTVLHLLHHIPGSGVRSHFICTLQ